MSDTKDPIRAAEVSSAVTFVARLLRQMRSNGGVVVSEVEIQKSLTDHLASLNSPERELPEVIE